MKIQEIPKIEKYHEKKTYYYLLPGQRESDLLDMYIDQIRVCHSDSEFFEYLDKIGLDINNIKVWGKF
jgi:hypothetical protein